MPANQLDRVRSRSVQSISTSNGVIGDAMTRDSVTIEQRAYELFLARACEHGHDLEDWLQAEREIQMSRPPVAPGR